jgi:hypothetical protein
MADYKELLRRAISALPENNGAARRAVYEKARSALVGQLRAINPPLPARDITQHRLQLEDCIRQVEQEASEAVITLGREPLAARVPIDPVPRSFAEPKPVEKPAVTPRQVETPKAEVPKPAPKAEPVVAKATPPKPAPEPVEPAEAAPVSIEDIIAEAAATTGVEVTEVAAEAPAKVAEPRVVPTIVSRNDGKSGSAGSSNVRPFEAPLKPATFEPRREATPAAASRADTAVARVEPSLGGAAALARQPDIAPVETALSSVREVELEAPQADRHEAEGVIAQAIETLDREARGETTAPLSETATKPADIGAFGVAKDKSASDDGFAEPAAPVRSGTGLTIFLVVFAILLAGAGGAGFWAWREGYVDLDQMFGRAQTNVAEPETPTPTPQFDPAPSGEVSTQPVEEPTGPGNTATNQPPEPTMSLEGEIDDRLEPTPEPVVPTGTETALPDIGVTGEEKSEERLSGEDTSIAANDPAASVDPAVLAGSQSLLLEASADGSSGAVPFSGTVEWSEGTDELGLPTLIGHASIPARSLGVDVTIRKNSDPSLPASHLLEVDFNVSDSFIGGTISNLPGVLLKDQELVPGTPLVGASARVVGNSFLFALSASDADQASNTNLLESRRWMDLAVVYGTGRNAILTLEKDDEAQALFEKVFTAWAE